MNRNRDAILFATRCFQGQESIGRKECEESSYKGGEQVEQLATSALATRCFESMKCTGVDIGKVCPYMAQLRVSNKEWSTSAMCQ
jgi:hypothetical protein